MFSAEHGREARWRYAGWASVLMVAAIVRLLILGFVSHPELREGSFAFAPLSDELQYHNIAVALAQSGRYLHEPGGVPTATRTPGSTVPLAFAYWVFGADPLIGVLQTELFSLLCVMLVGLLASRTYHSEIACLSAMLAAALLPSLAMFSAGIWSDPPTTFWVLCALYSVQTIEEKPDQKLHLVLLGLFLALAYLTRTSSSFLVAAVLVRLLFRAVRLRRMRQLLVVSAIAALPVLAWGVHNRVVLGQFFFGSSLQGHALFVTNNAVSAGLELPAMRFRDGFDLYEEAQGGMFLGHGLPPDYILAQPPEFNYGRAELAVNSSYSKKAAEFLRREPTALFRLLAFKVRRLLTAEPYAPSILGLTRKDRLYRWLVAAVERWIIFAAGVSGLFLMYRQRSPHLAPFVLFFLASIAPVLVSAPSARNLLPATVVLTIPAGLAFSQLWTRLLTRSH